MDQKWIHILMILVFHQNMSSGAVKEITTKDGDHVDIKCAAVSSTIILWFRILDTSGVEFIASFSNNGLLKSGISADFTHSKMSESILTLKSFKAGDSGAYSCAAFKNNELIFGEVTRLVGEKAKTVTKAPPITPHGQKNQPTTTTACDCDAIRQKQVEGEGLYSLCSPIILGPLAGSCGLLLLLLIIISVYCNQIRTRRCPHHYKRKPRAVAPVAGKEMMVNRRV